jgi:hypothetical protein
MPEPSKRIRYHRVRDLPDEVRDRMWELVSPAVQTGRPTFERGLTNMDEVWVLDVGGRVMGFGGVRHFYPVWQGSTQCVIFTGRVFLERSMRGANVLPPIGFRYFMRHRAKHPLQRTYWMFGAGSYKSYLLLPHNFEIYWPRPGATLPERECAVLDSVARSLGNPLYDPTTGIMSHPDLVYLDGNIERDLEAHSDPDVAFYARMNPGQARGDDLMCLCPLDARNWLAVAAAIAQRALRRVAPVSG